MDRELKAGLESIQTNALKAIDELNSEYRAANDRNKRRLDNIERELEKPTGVYHPSGASVGDHVAQKLWDSSEFKQFAKTGRGRMAIPLENFSFYGESKSTITTGTVGSSTPGILVPARFPEIIKPGIRKLRIRDVLDNYSASSGGSQEWVKENALTNATSPQTEASDKPESALSFTIDVQPFQVLATWIPASRQILDDFAPLQQYLNRRLIEALRDVEDYELLSGSGVGIHLKGLLSGATAFDTTKIVGATDTAIDYVDRALAQIDAQNLNPSAIILNPSDWRNKFQVAKATTGSYLLGGPASDAPYQLWGLPVSATTAMPQGKFCVLGAGCAAVFDRMQATIDLSTEHSDFFVKNLVAVRVEERLLLATFRSQGIIYGSLP